jgi:TatD DNase family protein
MTSWIDTHCHLDAPEFGAEAPQVRARARQAGVRCCVIPGVELGNFAAVRGLAHQGDDAYALGIHPLYVARAADTDLAGLADELQRQRGDPRLVALGEIGLDFFVPELQQSPLRERQEYFYREQLKLARQHDFPVILHVRRSADRLLKHLRELAPAGGWRGIAHAFNGSQQQAEAFVGMGFKLGFGGTLTFEAARQIRQLATTLPLQALVLETDAPDMPPHWLYQTAQARAAGVPQGRNEPAQLPRIAQTLAELRGISIEALAVATTANALAALPRLAALSRLAS